MSGRCEQCEKPYRGAGNKTFTRTLCDDCFARFSGQAAGLVAHGNVEGAIATAGWFARLRELLKKR